MPEELNLADFELDVRSFHDGFRYHIMFRFTNTRKLYSGEGTAPSILQCVDLAIEYMNRMMHEAA